MVDQTSVVPEKKKETPKEEKKVIEKKKEEVKKVSPIQTAVHMNPFTYMMRV